VLLVRGGEQLLVVVSSVMGLIIRLLSDKRRYPEQVHSVVTRASDIFEFHAQLVKN
jgi:hypothetical protein